MSTMPTGQESIHSALPFLDHWDRSPAYPALQVGHSLHQGDRGRTPSPRLILSSDGVHQRAQGWCSRCGDVALEHPVGASSSRLPSSVSGRAQSAWLRAQRLISKTPSGSLAQSLATEKSPSPTIRSRWEMRPLAVGDEPAESSSCARSVAEAHVRSWNEKGFITSLIGCQAFIGDYEYTFGCIHQTSP